MESVRGITGGPAGNPMLLRKAFECDGPVPIVTDDPGNPWYPWNPWFWNPCND
jgi:hypothetical protein